MVPADFGVEQTTAAAARLDPESAEWLRVLAGTGPPPEAALALRACGPCGEDFEGLLAALPGEEH